MQMRKLLSPASPQLVNYNFTDIAAGTGVTEFYGGRLGDNVLYSYALSNNKFYSSKVMTDLISISVNSYAIMVDVDFDVKFNQPKIMNGKAIVNIPLGAEGLAASSLNMYSVGKLYKWDGTTETLLGYASGAALVTGGLADGDFITGMNAVEVPLENVHFKKDETLRLTVQLIGKTGQLNSAHMFIGHDPQNRPTSGFETVPAGNPVLTFGTSPSVLSVQIPFKLDI